MLRRQRTVNASGELQMPYSSSDELPPAVRDHLPPHARDIFREAFNHAWDEYGGDEERAFRVAWAAVKRQYHKRGNKWVLIGQ
jgi:cation transport regulator